MTLTLVKEERLTFDGKVHSHPLKLPPTEIYIRYNLMW